MLKPKKLIAMLTATVLSIGIMSVSASAATSQKLYTRKHEMYVIGPCDVTICSRITQQRAGSSGYYEYPLAYGYKKVNKTFFGNLYCYAGCEGHVGGYLDYFAEVHTDLGSEISLDSNHYTRVWTDKQKCTKGSKATFYAYQWYYNY